MSSREIIFSAAGAGGPVNYIDDVFSTWLYTGTSATQTITNGIDLAGKGGLVWQKIRSTAGYDHVLTDTATSGTGASTKFLSSNTTNSFSSNTGNIIGSYNANGFTLNSGSGYNNENGLTAVSWTFRKQAKFFDVVTWTGNGSTAQTISHNLGSTPGFIITKKTSATSAWWSYHRGIANANQQGIRLNTTNAATNVGVDIWNPTSTTFQADSNLGLCDSGATYVAYLFAHDAGGFGTSGTDNVISCGSYTGNGSANGPTINLGYEPQYLMIKNASGTANWFVMDVMRGIPMSGNTATLKPNTSDAEDANQGHAVELNATGFQVTSTFSGTNLSGATYIYMAIRRPMKPPTSGTEVFSPVTSSATVGTQLTTNFVIDSQWINYRTGASENTAFNDRLRGNSSTTTSSGNILTSSSTAAESSITSTRNWGNTGFQVPTYYSGGSTIYWNFRRAPGFFDVVCYTGTGASRSLAHNLTVPPELVIIKSRSNSFSWSVGSLFTSSNFVYYTLESTDAGQSFAYTAGVVFNGQPTASNVLLNSSGGTNSSGATYVAYLFASVAGISKVGSYTGTGSTQTINCGFTGGARFVLIKCVDAAGSWFVWDTARGMVSGTDPRLALNLTSAENNQNWVYTVTTGFQIVTTNASVNANGGSYIYLAIA